jgi:hypothetical protein
MLRKGSVNVRHLLRSLFNRGPRYISRESVLCYELCGALSTVETQLRLVGSQGEA